MCTPWLTGSAGAVIGAIMAVDYQEKPYADV
jgi:hypothetical protein